MQVRRVIKGNVPVSIFDLQIVGEDKLPSSYVATTDIKNIYSEYKEDIIGIHTHNFYLISWITDGHCDYNVDMNNYKIQPNTIILLKPGELHRFSNVIDLEGVNFYFTSDVLSNVNSAISAEIDMELFTKNHIISVTSNRTEEILKVYTNLLCSMCKCSHDGFISQEIKKMEMLIFLLRLLECEEIQHNKSTNLINKNTYQIFLRFQKMVDEKYQSLHKVQDYSKLLNTSSKHLTECVRENSTKSPLQIINQRRLLQSQRLLLFTQLRIKEIAINLGFIDTSHFVKFFKKEIGVTPSEYREKLTKITAVR